jgi:hypothetical protein
VPSPHVLKSKDFGMNQFRDISFISVLVQEFSIWWCIKLILQPLSAKKKQLLVQLPYIY